jgi:hypothetical protein
LPLQVKAKLKLSGVAEIYFSSVCTEQQSHKQQGMCHAVHVYWLVLCLFQVVAAGVERV